MSGRAIKALTKAVKGSKSAASQLNIQKPLRQRMAEAAARNGNQVIAEQPRSGLTQAPKKQRVKQVLEPIEPNANGEYHINDSQVRQMKQQVFDHMQGQKELTGTNSFQGFGKILINGEHANPHSTTSLEKTVKASQINLDLKSRVKKNTGKRESKTGFGPKVVERAYAYGERQGIPKTEVDRYIQHARMRKKSIEIDNRKRNITDGDRAWSLGHKHSVANMPDDVGTADLYFNMEPEQYKTIAGKRGNASRSHKDDFPREVQRALGIGLSVEEDMDMFLGNLAGDLWTPGSMAHYDAQTRQDIGELIMNVWNRKYDYDMNYTYNDAINEVFNHIGLPNNSRTN